MNVEAGRRDDAWPTVSRDDIPRRRIERYEPQREEEGRFGGINEGGERHDWYVVVEVRRSRLSYRANTGHYQMGTLGGH